MAQNGIRNLLENNPLIPVVTFTNTDEIDKCVAKLKSEGIACMEITLRTAFAFDAIDYAKKRYGNEFAIGVGTIVTRDQVENAKAHEVDFMVSPGISKSLAPYFEQSQIPFIPGVATPSEIIDGMQYEYDTFKFFPANLYGGIPALKTFGQVFPGIKFCPTGGIKADTYKDFLALDNVIAVGGSWMG